MPHGKTKALREVRSTKAIVYLHSPQAWAEANGYQWAGQPNPVPRSLRRNNKHNRRRRREEQRRQMAAELTNTTREE